MNNEPVAWLDKRTNKCVVFINTPPSDDWIPLYTHPVKELTDEEIQEIAHSFGEIAWLGDTTYEFARTLLRKAQEK